MKEITKKKRQSRNIERLDNILDGVKQLSNGMGKIEKRIGTLTDTVEEYGRFRKAVSELAAPEMIEEICQKSGVDPASLAGKPEQTPAA